MTRASAGSEDDLRAIVRPRQAMRHFRLRRYRPETGLDRLVDRIWKAEWELTEPFTQQIVTFPVVNLVFQSDGSAVVSGVQTRPDRRELTGRGWALGYMFRPGGFAPLSDRPMRELVDRRIDARDVLGAEMGDVVEEVLACEDDLDRIAAVSSRLAAMVPTAPTEGEAVSDLVERAAAAIPPVTRVDRLAELHGVSARSLQRLFARTVGVGPKTVLSRYRVQAAAEQARTGVETLADTAVRLGYADQAHLTNDLGDQFGSPPGSYRRSEWCDESSSAGPDRPGRW